MEMFPGLQSRLGNRTPRKNQISPPLESMDLNLYQTYVPDVVPPVGPLYSM